MRYSFGIFKSHAYELQRLRWNAFYLKAEFDRFVHPFHKFVKRAPLCVAAGQLRNGADV